MLCLLYSSLFFAWFKDKSLYDEVIFMNMIEFQQLILSFSLTLADYSAPCMGHQSEKK